MRSRVRPTDRIPAEAASVSATSAIAPALAPIAVRSRPNAVENRSVPLIRVALIDSIRPNAGRHRAPLRRSNGETGRS